MVDVANSSSLSLCTCGCCHGLAKIENVSTGKDAVDTCIAKDMSKSKSCSALVCKEEEENMAKKAAFVLVEHDHVESGIRWMLYDLPGMKPSLAPALSLSSQGLPEGKAFVCLKDWVVVVSKGVWNLTLVNPFSGKVINLPSLHPDEYVKLDPPNPTFLEDTYEEYYCQCSDLAAEFDPSTSRVRDFITKFVMSANPEQGDTCYLVAMLNPLVCFDQLLWGDRILAFYKLENTKSDASVESSSKLSKSSWVPVYVYPYDWNDGVFFKGRFVLLTCGRMLFSFSFEEGIGDGEQIRLVSETELDTKPIDDYAHCLYELRHLVTMDDDLYLVVRYTDPAWKFIYHSRVELPEFDPVLVFRIHIGSGTLTPVTDLGKRALFVGDNSTFFIDVDGESGFDPSTVYFSPQEHFYGFPSDPMIFPPLGCVNLKDKRTQLLPWDFKKYCRSIPVFL